MKIVKSNNIYINIGDNQYTFINNNHIYSFKNYFFNNIIILKYCNKIFRINLFNKKYFQIKIINLGNYIFIYVFNKSYLFFYKSVKINLIDNNNFEYNNKIFLKYQLTTIINIVKNKLNNEIKLPESVIFNINNKLNIIMKKINELNEQKILYYIKYLTSNFHI